MKKMLALLLVPMLAVLAVATSNKSANVSLPPEPKAVIASLEHAFGKVKPGTPLTHSFTVRNEGGADLEIKSVSPACGCTATNFDKVIPPGKAGKITLSIEHTESYKGELLKTAAVTTNDPKRQALTLTLRANFVD